MPPLPDIKDCPAGVLGADHPAEAAEFAQAVARIQRGPILSKRGKPPWLAPKWISTVVFPSVAAELIRDDLGKMGSHLHQFQLLQFELQSHVTIPCGVARSILIQRVAEQPGDDVAGVLQVLG